MEENEDYARWNKEILLPRYPGPHKNPAVFAPAEEVAPNFHFIEEETVEGTKRFALEPFVDYLTSISNIILAVENGATTLEAIKAWLRQELAPYFGANETRTFIFSRPIWYFA